MRLNAFRSVLSEHEIKKNEQQHRTIISSSYLNGNAVRDACMRVTNQNIRIGISMQSNLGNFSFANANDVDSGGDGGGVDAPIHTHTHNQISFPFTACISHWLDLAGYVRDT